MPKIRFRILSSAEQREDIVDDFRRMIAALSDSLDADLEIHPGLVADPELMTTWIELFGESAEEPEGAEVDVTVRNYALGSISSLTMSFAELLTTREKEPAEPLMRQVKDDSGTPRVPWHVEVQP